MGNVESFYPAGLIEIAGDTFQCGPVKDIQALMECGQTAFPEVREESVNLSFFVFHCSPKPRLGVVK